MDRLTVHASSHRPGRLGLPSPSAAGADRVVSARGIGNDIRAENPLSGRAAALASTPMTSIACIMKLIPATARESSLTRLFGVFHRGSLIGQSCPRLASSSPSCGDIGSSWPNMADQPRVSCERAARIASCHGTFIVHLIVTSLRRVTTRQPFEFWLLYQQQGGRDIRWLPFAGQKFGAEKPTRSRGVQSWRLGRRSRHVEVGKHTDTSARVMPYQLRL